MAQVTTIALTRHGHGTAAMLVDGLARTTEQPHRLIYADIGSPASVAGYLADQQSKREGEFVHLRFDGPVSRQMARRKALELVDTEYTLILDNNMLLAEGAIEALIDTADETGAALVSPVIVSLGGAIHYSGGVVRKQRSARKLGRQVTSRPQDATAKMRTPLQDVNIQRTDVDFAESHCCLARTEALRRPGVLIESMHNAHTMCFAGYKLRNVYRQRIVLEPASVASIVPVAFGYDLPWMCLEYMRLDRLTIAYRNLRGALGAGPDTELATCVPWHAKHFKYLLLNMLEDDRLDSDGQVDLDQIPESLTGYDAPLPSDTNERLTRELVPRVAERFPDLMVPLKQWLNTRHC